MKSAFETWKVEPLGLLIQTYLCLLSRFERLNGFVKKATHVTFRDDDDDDDAVDIYTTWNKQWLLRNDNNESGSLEEEELRCVSEWVSQLCVSASVFVGVGVPVRWHLTQHKEECVNEWNR